MTRDEAKQLLPIIKAYAEGKKIEVRTRDEGEWRESHGFFNLPPDRYRIKPDPIECWAVVSESGVTLAAHGTEAQANLHANTCFAPSVRIIRMREVL